MSSSFDPNTVDLDTADPAAIICYLNAGKNEYDGHLGTRISALFVILILSSAATLFPVLAVRMRWMKIPIYVYLFARYFGAGVIIATAFIHLLDPAYSEIGPLTCVGMTGGWASYSWPPAIVLITTMLIFLLDFAAERYVEIKYGYADAYPDVEGIVTEPGDKSGAKQRPSHPPLDSGNPDDQIVHGRPGSPALQVQTLDKAGLDRGSNREHGVGLAQLSVEAEERSFRTQIAAFLILEFGVIFHSVIIGLKLGTAGSEFSTLYPVIVFHQAFEGLGIGARMSAIPFPKRLSWLCWSLCAGYGLTTPIAIAIGLGLRTTYNSGSFTASVVSGVLDSISAGILIYTGLVELLARDFLFNQERTRDGRQLAFMVTSLFIGAALMALLGKWA
ncbi:probable ZRT1 Zinc transporter I [Phialocephala subalpina]|uniref:Probable ZRT1 Zinc transporter I n=1 Tax=Phialocephala subalpina TaxID=576137 RepID=A0A1L7XJU4_9HELO|nr:probable ZRT1 Zinc transporter I [Phialocephala subalpina]